MSSLRNSLHRRNHKERSQLANRSRLGILEKHKDYVLRARDYHSKQDRLTRLRQKAAERNKDEFYFAMNRQRTSGGMHIQDRGNTALPTDIVKVLKTQDENYLRTMRTAGSKKIDKLKIKLSALVELMRPASFREEDGLEELSDEELEVLIDARIFPAPPLNGRRSGSGVKGKHIVFAESAEEARDLVFSREDAKKDEDERMEEDVIDLGWRGLDEHSKVQRAHASDQNGSLEDHVTVEEKRRGAALKHRARLLKELSARLFRDRQLRYAERELEMQRLLMGKGGARRLRGVEKVENADDDDEDEDEPRGGDGKKVDEKVWKPRVYKWRVERKK
ncbi:small-subunit processome [Laetiporus sulphureus 93-53]|uniref:Small-subunit processome n=1 Tax=Laetiporus sulphureus 93-53 TaxID=1314785 RepID=A0A165CB43_9APHY|nr:small-subunit processome [Laetiporus sulphureus 93-53]KZT02490.1 small-subunit processome [Laetiporus sulphureus 93-53]